MLNEEKISLMTKLALYEQGEGKKEIPMSGYYRGDYVSLKVVNSAIVGTIAYFLVIGSLILINAEELLNKLTEINLVSVGREILIYYIGFLLCYMFVAYIFYNVKFRTVRNRLNQYNADLKKLYEFYKNDKNPKEVKVNVRKRKLEKKEKEKVEEEIEEIKEIEELGLDTELEEILELIEE